MYKLYKNSFGGNNVLKVNDDGSITSFCIDENSTDYQAFLAWVAEGNAPLPPDEPPVETP
jgi:hypothetical protein